VVGLTSFFHATFTFLSSAFAYNGTRIKEVTEGYLGKMEISFYPLLSECASTERPYGARVFDGTNPSEIVISSKIKKGDVFLFSIV
jgi:hypothetical protein